MADQILASGGTSQPLDGGSSGSYLMNGFSGFGGSAAAMDGRGADPEAAKTLSWANMVRKTQGLRPLGSLLAAGALAAYGFYGASRSSERGAVASPMVPLYQYEDPPLPSTDDYGGAKDNILPQLTSASNRENRDGPVPRLLGIDVRFFPVISAHPFPSVYGANQSLSGVLACGPGPLELSAPQISKRPITEFPSIQIGYQYGQSDDTALQFYLTDIENVSVNEPILNTSQFKTKRAGQKATRLGINLVFPNGLFKRVNGVITTETIHIRIYIRNLEQPFATVDEYIDISGAQTSMKIWYKEYAVPEALYDVSIERFSSPDGTDNNTVNACTWTDLTAATDGKPFLDIHNSLGQKVWMAQFEYRATSTADLQGSVDEISLLGSSKVPIWNGSTWSAPTKSNNPAWLWCQVLRGVENYRPVEDDQIDLPRILEWAQFCTDNNFTYNKVLEGMNVEDSCREIAAAGRAQYIMRNGQHSVVIDKPQDTVVQVFTTRNIIKDSFSMEGHYVDPPDYVECIWVNPAVDWQQDKRQVYDDGKIKDVDFKMDTLTLPGVTNADVVYKLGRYYLAVNRLRNQTYKFSADIEQLRCELGDRIQLNHDRLGIGLGRGRITALAKDGSNNITGISIDARQVMGLDKQYEVTIRTATGAVLTKEVVAIDGQSKSLTFTSNIAHDASDLPQIGDLVCFGEKGFSTRDLIITSIEPQPDLSAVITCVDYAPQVYDADKGAIPPYTPMVSRPRNLETAVPAPVILGAQTDENVLLENSDGSLKTIILLTLQALPLQVTTLEWQIALAGTDAWTQIRQATPLGGSLVIDTVEDRQTYDIRVRARINNFFGAWTYRYGEYVTGKSTKPPDVLYITRLPAPNNSLIRVENYTKPRDFRGFVWKLANDDNRNWAQGSLLQLGGGDTLDIGGLAAGVKTIMVKGLDVAGNESENIGFITVDFGDPVVSNVIYEMPHHPTWSTVTITNGTIDGSEIKADDDGSLWFGDDLDAEWWDGLPGDDWFGQSYKEMVIEWDFTPATDEPKPYKVMVSQKLISMGWKLEYTIIGAEPWWGDNPLSLDEDWFDGDLSGPWFGSDAPVSYFLMPTNGLEGEAGLYRFRLTAYGSPFQTIVQELATILDAKDIVVEIPDFIVDNTAGKKITLPSGVSFRAIKTIQVTLEEDLVNFPTAATAKYSNKEDVTGPTIKVFTAAGAGTTGKVDVTLKGY